jgi:outer membrane protein assembly factor BamA
VESISVSVPGKPDIAVPKATIDLQDEGVTFNKVTALLGGGEAALEGTLPLAAAFPALRADRTHVAPAEEAHLTLQWSGLEMGKLFPGGSLDGTLSGESHLDGGVRDVREARVRVALPETTLTAEDVSFTIDPLTIGLERGRATLQEANLKTTGGEFHLGGSAELPKGALSGSLRGSVDLRALSPFLSETSVGGSARVDISLGGTLAEPAPAGTIEVKDGVLRLRAFPQPLTAMGGLLSLAGHSLRLEGFSAEMGGGHLQGEGTARLQGVRVKDIEAQVTGQGIGLKYPEGLRSRVDADLTLKGEPGRLFLLGDVTADRGIYDLDFVLTQSLTTRAPVATDSPFLRSIAADLKIETKNPVRVRNNLAHLEVSGILRLRGDLNDPAPFGRLDLQPDGKIQLQGRDFTISTGYVTYAGSFDPQVHVDTELTIPDKGTNQEYLVTVGVAGPLSLPKLSFQSDPALTDDQIINLIATGKVGQTSDAARVAGAQAASVLASNLGTGLSKGLAGVGLGDISVRPELLAQETNPGARFTFGKELTGNVSLLYSLPLNDTQGHFLQLVGRPFRDARLLLQRADDGTITYGAGQTVRFGGFRPKIQPLREGNVTLSAVRFEGDLPMDKEALGRVAGLRAGLRVSPWKLQDNADRLRSALVERGFIEAEVGARTEEGSVAVLRIHSGPHFSYRVTGIDNPPDLGKILRKALFEDEAIEKGRDRFLETLRERGDLRARVDVRGVDEGGSRVLVFEGKPGPAVRLRAVEFPGATSISHGDLLKAASGPGGLLTSPEEGRRAILALYRKRGFTSAQVASPIVLDSSEGVSVRVGVTEGRAARVAAVRFEGASLWPAMLLRLAAIQPGTTALDAPLAVATDRIRAEYLERGFASVRVVPSLVPAGADFDVLFSVDEGEKVVVGTITISGLTRTHDSLVRRQIDIQPGDPLDLRRLGSIERRLLDLGIFDRVVVSASEDNPAAILVDIKEGPVATAGYDLRWNDVDHGTALGDAELKNLFGLGLTLGGRYKVGSSLRDARGTLHASSVFFLGDLTATVYRVELDSTAIDFDTLEPITNAQIQKGFRILSNRKVSPKWRLEFGYDRNTVTSTVAPTPITSSGLHASALSEARDNVLDPTSGRFLSASVNYEPRWLGSDFTFVKSLGQAFFIHKLTPSLLWAHGYRLGLAWAFGGQILNAPTESGEPLDSSATNFQTGGADSLRGYGSRQVGPVDELGLYLGGDAVLVVNQELRYRHPSGLGAAVFYDAGNVFPTVSDLSFHLRHDLGVGLRYVSPVGLLRLDLAFPLNPQVGDKRYRIFFSLGQIF